MDVKLRQGPDRLLPLFRSKFEFPSSSFCLESWAKSERLLKKHIGGKKQKWRIRIEEMSKDQCWAEQCSVHGVKEGENLTSISKHYGVSMYAIAAANKNIADIDLDFEGEHLYIPSADKNVLETQRSWSGKFKIPLKDQSSSNILSGVLAQRISACYIRICTGSQNLMSTTGSSMRASGEFLHKTVNESDVKHLRSQGGRWRSALDDAWELERADADSIPDSTVTHSEDQDQLSLEEEAHAYRKLEHDYQEFLTQCGMSKWGLLAR